MNDELIIVFVGFREILFECNRIIYILIIVDEEVLKRIFALKILSRSNKKIF